jgi:UDP-N-acetylmuramate--alanine ligase
MSGIARVLLARGIEVSGSDAKDSRRLQALKPLGGQVFIGHDENQLEISGTLPSCVVVSTAIGTDNAEVLKATQLGIPVINRATALAELLIGSTTISVAGTHGKTTTTSMVTVILQHAGKDPSFVIGSEMNESGSNAHQGSGELFVVEADESDGTFLVLPTTFAIVTNVEADHLNYWETYAAIEEAFVDFMVGTKSNGGSSIVCGDDAGAREVAKRAEKLGAKIITYGQLAQNSQFDTATKLTGQLNYWFLVCITHSMPRLLSLQRSSKGVHRKTVLQVWQVSLEPTADLSSAAKSMACEFLMITRIIRQK